MDINFASVLCHPYMGDTKLRLIYIQHEKFSLIMFMNASVLGKTD